MAERIAAFVAGATGYVGREVVRVLRDKDIETIAHVRPGSSSLERFTNEFTEIGARVDTSSWDGDDMAESLAAAKPTLVFALLGTTRKRARAEKIDGDPYHRVDYGLTAHLFKAAVAIEPPPRFVYLSAAGVKDSARTAYMAARVKAEKMIRSGPLPYVIARPAVITGSDRDDGRFGERVGGAVIDGALAVVGLFGAKKTRELYRSTTNTVLAAALVRLAIESTETSVIAEGRDLR